MRITNMTTRPVVLEDGTILAALGTEGATKTVESLSETDARRLGDSIVVRDVEVEVGKAPGGKAGANLEEKK